jgi:hypothetical protein
MDIPSLDDIWQETLGLDDFDAGRLEAAITRNQRPAYGLTLWPILCVGFVRQSLLS